MKTFSKIRNALSTRLQNSHFLFIVVRHNTPGRTEFPFRMDGRRSVQRVIDEFATERLPLSPPRGELKLRPEANTYVLLSAPQVQPRVKFSSCSSSKYTPSRFPRLSSSMHLGVVATPVSTPRDVKYISPSC